MLNVLHANMNNKTERSSIYFEKQPCRAAMDAVDNRLIIKGIQNMQEHRFFDNLACIDCPVFSDGDNITNISHWSAI